MSMLAEQRKTRQKGSFKTETNPRGDLWVKDDSKLGQKMLENMGWSKGDGLGKNKQGESDALKPISNTGKSGLGLSDAVDHEAWSKNHDNFEDVLANLNALNNTTPHDSENEECGKKERKFSLENSSKESKARVHYKKFLRGKDVSGYKEDDLACVTGSKKLRKKKVENPEEIVDESQKELNEPENIIYGGNLKEYFSKKMSELSRKRSEGLLASATNCETENMDSIVDLQFTPSKKDFSFSVDCRNGSLTNQNVEEEEQVTHSGRKDKKKKKKTNETVENSDAGMECQPFHPSITDLNPIGEVLKLFKKKKNKNRLSNVVENSEEGERDVAKVKKSKKKIEDCEESNKLDDNIKSKKNKKKKNKVAESDEPENNCDNSDLKNVENSVEVESSAEELRKRRKEKKKKKGVVEDSLKEGDTEETDSPKELEECSIDANEEKHNNVGSEDTREKRRKSKQETECGSRENKENDDVEANWSKRKQKKKRKSLENESLNAENCDVLTPVVEKKKKKSIEKCTPDQVEDNDTSDIINQSYLSATQIDKKEKRKVNEVEESENDVKFNPMKKMKKISSKLNLGELFNSGLENSSNKKKIKKDLKKMKEISERCEAESKELEEKDNELKQIEATEVAKSEVWKKKKTWSVKSKNKKLVFDVEKSFPGSNIFGIKGYPF